MPPIRYFFVPFIGVAAMVEALLMGMDPDDRKIKMGCAVQAIYTVFTVVCIVYTIFKFINHLFA